MYAQIVRLAEEYDPSLPLSRLFASHRHRAVCSAPAAWGRMSMSTLTPAHVPTSSEGPAALPPWLEGLLANPKNRDTLARLESGLVSFMLDAARVELALPPCSAFQRRVCVEVARRFGLEHRVDHAVGPTHDPAAVLVVLRKCPQSAIPDMMLSQAISDIKPRLVKRPKALTPNNAGLSLPAVGATPTSSSAAIKKVSQEEYEQARARIFNDPNETDAAVPLVRYVGGGVARGPEEGQSFARRRVGLGAGNNAGNSERPSEQRVGGGQRQPITGCTTSEAGGGNDRDDPDFDRCYDKWARRRTSVTSATAATPPILYGPMYGYMPPYFYHLPPQHPPQHPPAPLFYPAPAVVSNRASPDATGSLPAPTASPAYGLDDTADFPPLSAAPRTNQR